MKSTGANLWLISALGSIGGILVWLFLSAVRNSPWIGLGIGGLIVFLAALSYFIPFLPYESSAVLIADSEQTMRTFSGKLPIPWMDARSIALRHVEASPERKLLTVHVRNPDRFVAQREVQTAIAEIMDAAASRRSLMASGGVPALAPSLEVIDPASLSVFRVVPRDEALGGGLILILAAVFFLAYDRRKPVAVPA